MANLGITLKQLMKSVKKGTHPLADYMKFEREMSGVPLHMPVTGDEIRRARNIVNPIDTKKQKVIDVIHTNTGKYDKKATKFLKKAGYNEKGEFDVGKFGDPVIHNRDIFEQVLYDKFYLDMFGHPMFENIGKITTHPTYMNDPIANIKKTKQLSKVKSTKDLIYKYLSKNTSKQDRSKIYDELIGIMKEPYTYDVNKRYKQIADWKNRANVKYKEIVNPSGPTRRLSYTNKRYTNMDDPIQGDAFNEDFDMFDLEDYIQRENISNPYLKSYLEGELRKLNPKDAYDAEIIRQLEQKL